MIRKQIYLAQEQDRKVKALAALRGSTESDVIREAIDLLPDSDGGLVEQLRAAGLLVPKHRDPTLPSGEELRKLEAKVVAVLESLPADKSLSAAILEDREGR